MLYGDRLKQALKVETNPINKMYLNELILSWSKVETAFSTESESPIISVVTAVSEYTKHLTNPKFSYQKDKGIGFMEDHDIFKAHYLFDLAEKLLLEAGTFPTAAKRKGAFAALAIKQKPFTTSLRLENNSFAVQSQNPLLEFTTSNKYLHLGLEFDLHYRLIEKKNFIKAKLYVPLIVFYIEKVFTENSFKEIEQLKKEIKELNPNAVLFCLTEYAEKKLMKLYTPIKDIVYIARASMRGEPLKPLQPQVFLSLYSKISHYIHREKDSFDKYVPFGHIDLFREIPKEEKNEGKDQKTKSSHNKEKHDERKKIKNEMKRLKEEAKQRRDKEKELSDLINEVIDFETEQDTPISEPTETKPPVTDIKELDNIGEVAKVKRKRSTTKKVTASTPSTEDPPKKRRSRKTQETTQE